MYQTRLDDRTPLPSRKTKKEDVLLNVLFVLAPSIFPGSSACQVSWAEPHVVGDLMTRFPVLGIKLIYCLLRPDKQQFYNFFIFHQVLPPFL